MNDNLPSVQAVDAALECARVWGNGFPTAACKFKRSLFACTETKNAVFVKNIATNQTGTILVTDAPGTNSVMALATLLDYMTNRRQLDYDLGLEMIEECFGSLSTRCEHAAVAYALKGVLFVGGGLDRFTLGLYTAAAALGFNNDDTWDFLKTEPRLNPKASIADNILYQLGSLYEYKTRTYVDRFDPEEWEGWDPTRDL